MTHTGLFLGGDRHGRVIGAGTFVYLVPGALIIVMRKWRTVERRFKQRTYCYREVS